MHRKYHSEPLISLYTHDSEEAPRRSQDNPFELCKAPPNRAIIEHQPWNLLQPGGQYHSGDTRRYIAYSSLHIPNHPLSRNEKFPQREQLQNMDALDWATGHRPNRPFQNIHSQSLHKISHMSKPQRPPLHRQVEPTEYFKEQLFLARDGPYPEPYPHLQPTKTPRGIIDLWIVLFVTSVILPFLDAIQLIAKYIVINILTAICFDVARSFKPLAHPAAWDVVMALVFAMETARWLPGMKYSTQRPLYTICLARSAIEIWVR